MLQLYAQSLMCQPLQLCPGKFVNMGLNLQCKVNNIILLLIRTHAPGDKPHITEVKEQRISGFIVSLLIGLSVTMAPLLRLIPMSVLFGVFLYMGIASMSGVQFFER